MFRKIITNKYFIIYICLLTLFLFSRIFHTTYTLDKMEDFRTEMRTIKWPSHELGYMMVYRITKYYEGGIKRIDLMNIYLFFYPYFISHGIFDGILFILIIIYPFLILFYLSFKKIRIRLKRISLQKIDSKE